MGKLQNVEDIRLVKSYLVLPVTLEIIERNLKLIKLHNFKLSEVFVGHLINLRNKVNLEYYNVKQEMKRLGIKVFEESRTDEGITGKYLCRGYQHEMTLLWMNIKSECEVKVAAMLDVDLSKVEYD
ncbi:hypothetical protein ACH6EH_07150 [Paenibacillus sp. JSM ZJ436]|uniref:hypothetical protein n=1 Tax=Paenibacillus sp. JSM ZJ436 TaxID=3376190 RepID=UPI0037B6279E